MVLGARLDRWGCSSNGRAPALHAGGTGIDTLLLHTFFVLFGLLFARICQQPSFSAGFDSRLAQLSFLLYAEPPLCCPSANLDRRGCSSNGRAPALHAGGTGIDTLLLHTFCRPVLPVNNLAGATRSNKCVLIGLCAWPPTASAL